MKSFELGNGCGGLIENENVDAEENSGRCSDAVYPAAVPAPRPVGVKGPWYRSEVFRFYIVGGASAAAYVLLYVLLRTIVSSQIANVLALFISAVGNTAANRRFTFGIRGTEAIVRQYVQGLVVFAVGLVVTSGSLWLLYTWSAEPSRPVEVSVLVAANLVATVVRFLGLRRVFTAD